MATQSTELYTRKDDIILTFKTHYQFRLRKFGKNELRGEVFSNQSWNGSGGDFKPQWRRCSYSITITNGRVYGLPNGSYLEHYAIIAFNDAFPHAKIDSAFWKL